MSFGLGLKTGIAVAAVMAFVGIRIVDRSWVGYVLIFGSLLTVGLSLYVASPKPEDRSSGDLSDRIDTLSGRVASLEVKLDAVLLHQREGQALGHRADGGGE